MTEDLGSRQLSPRVARKRDAARRRILRAAMVLVGEKGVDQMVVSKLADLADCSVGAFYTHFESKEALIDTLKAELIEPVGDAIDQYGQAANTAAEAVSAGLRYTLKLAQADPAWGRFVVATATSEDALTSGFGARILHDIRRGVTAGEFEISDEPAAMSILAGAFITGVMGASHSLLTEHSTDEAARHVLLAFGLPKKKAKNVSSLALPRLDASYDTALLPEFDDILAVHDVDGSGGGDADASQTNRT